MLLQQAQVASIRAKPPFADYTEDRQNLSSETESQVEVVLNDANNLRRALGPVPSLRAPFEEQLRAVRHVRNIREHWDKTRQFWSEPTPIPTNREFESARWFKKHFPDKVPWSWSWSNHDGAVICGVIRMTDLVDMLDQLDQRVRMA
jgi:hypothetical protein